MKRSSMPARSTALTRTAWKRRKKARTNAEQEARELVRVRAAGRCEGCGRPGECEWAHRVGRVQGGRWTAENGLWLCGDLTGGHAPTTGGGCHPFSHSAAGRPVCHARGWILERNEDPVTTPVLIHGRGLVLLAADGTCPTYRGERGMNPNYVQTVLDRLNQASPELDPDLAQLYALLAITKGDDTSLQDVHDAWALWRNTTNPVHRSLIPFDELSLEVQELDREYMEAIHKAAQVAA